LGNSCIDRLILGALFKKKEFQPRLNAESITTLPPVSSYNFPGFSCTLP
jgi:hypothetical protein